MTADPTGCSAAAAAAGVRAGELSAAELFETWRARAAGDELNAYLWVAQDLPAEPSRGPLGGVPVAVKDLFCVGGVPGSAGSRILAGYRPPYTATAVQRLLDAGAPVLGKTNMDEFAMGSSNENSAFGPVLNPLDRSRVPGGSSGGSAAAVAGGLAPWAIGTDTGGSIRQPAGFCGLVGFKPTYGAVSRYGMIAFASSLDQAGPITRDVTDAALLLGAMVGADARDSTSLGLDEPLQLPRAERLDGLRVGLWGLGEEGLQPGVAAVCRTVAGLVEELGGSTVEVDLPHAEYALSAYYLLAPAEASTNLARYDGVRYGLRASDADLSSMYEGTRHDGFGDEVKRRIMLGTFALSSGYYDAYYGRAQRVRTKVVEDYRAAFEAVDLLLTPTSPTVAFPLGERTSDPLSMYLADSHTVPTSLAGLPAISLPGGRSEGLPVGVQLIGPAFSENRILSAAHALEGAIGFEEVRRSRTVDDRPDAGRRSQDAGSEASRR